MATPDRDEVERQIVKLRADIEGVKRARAVYPNLIALCANGNMNYQEMRDEMFALFTEMGALISYMNAFDDYVNYLFKALNDETIVLDAVSPIARRGMAKRSLELGKARDQYRDYVRSIRNKT